MRRQVLPLILVAALAAAASAQRERPDERIRCGPLTIEVFLSRTAHVFHVVDQLSAWDNACHGQYRAHMELSEEDEAQLRAYAAVRRERRWGQGLEQTFYSGLDLDDAARAGRKGGHVTQPELDVIRPVLDHFAPRVDAMLEEARPELAAAFGSIDREALTTAARQLAALTGTKKLTVPAFPLASPTAGGGGMDGGKLRWEIRSREEMSFAVLVHELCHAFVMPHNDMLIETVDATPGLDLTLLGEGIAYAFAPGIWGDDGVGDNLKYNVDKDRANGEAWEDPGYGRQRMYGLAARPLLREVIANGETLEDLLPRMRLAYLSLKEIHETPAGRPPGPPRLAIAGPRRDAVRERLRESQFGLWIHRFNHDAGAYREVLPQLGETDWLVLLVAGDDGERVPDDFAHLSPLEADELERRLGRGKTVEEERVLASGLRVVLLAAPRGEDVERLARESGLLATQR